MGCLDADIVVHTGESDCLKWPQAGSDRNCSRPKSETSNVPIRPVCGLTRLRLMRKQTCAQKLCLEVAASRSRNVVGVVRAIRPLPSRSDATRMNSSTSPPPPPTPMKCRVFVGNRELLMPRVKLGQVFLNVGPFSTGFVGPFGHRAFVSVDPASRCRST